MDRLLAPTRPYNGVLRPSDGKEPENIAILLCVGSRDQTVCNPLCCRIGCMYSIKHAQLAMGALPMADITIYTIDVRAFGKGYDEFYEQAKSMGIEFVKGKVARIEQLANGNLALHYEDMLGEGGMKTARTRPRGPDRGIPAQYGRIFSLQGGRAGGGRLRLRARNRSRQ